MAIVGNDEEDLKRPTSSISPNAKATLGGAGGFVGGGGQGGGATTGAATPEDGSTKGGSSYTNLSQYLQANADNAGAMGGAAENLVKSADYNAGRAQQQFGSAASGDITKASQGLGVDTATQEKIMGGGSNIDQGVLNNIAAGGYQYDPTKAQQAFQNIGKAGDDELQGIVKEGETATSAYGGPSDFSQYGYQGPQYGTGRYGDIAPVAYQGPQNTSAFAGDTAALQQTAVDKNTRAADLGMNTQRGHEGAMALMREAYANPNYTRGETNLDAFLSRSTPEGQAAFSRAAATGKESGGKYKDLLAKLQGDIDAGKQTADATNTAYQGMIKDAENRSGETVRTYEEAARQAKARGEKDAPLAQYDAALAKGELIGRKKEEIKKEDDKPVIESRSPSKEENIVRSAQDKAKKGVDALGKAAQLGMQFYTDPGEALHKTGGYLSDLNKATMNAYRDPMQTAEDIKKAMMPSVRLAHGGKVPSYSQLCKMLRG